MLCLCINGVVSSTCAADRIEKAPVPDWVDAPLKAQQAEAASDSQIGGEQFLLVDQQFRVETGKTTSYNRYVSRAVNDGGVDAVSHIEVVFDPSYQRLTFHRLDVIREGKREDRLGPAKFDLLQRERELEQRIYDGSKSAYLALDDIRVGDVVDYAYSLSGSNPVFGGRASGGVFLQWAVPVERLRIRLWYPPEREIQVKTFRWDGEPKALRRAGWSGYEWSRDRVPALRLEEGAPSWFDPYPLAIWSEYRDWSQVVEWASPLYAIGTSLPSGLIAVVGEIKSSHATPEARLQAALRWVQANVRYLGIELGASSHAPADPALVFKRRFGDCKDKARLLLAMLQQLDIEAAPALVNTVKLTEETSLLPSPGRFNHVIVRARVDGQDFWLDPTRPAQGSSLDQLVQPDYGLALVLDKSSQQLLPMTPQRAVPRKILLNYDLREGLDAPAKLTITSEYRYRTAEAFRQRLADSSVAEVSKDYLNYYANFYPGISLLQPIDLQDDIGKNQLTVVERYEIIDLWSTDENQQREANFYVPDMRDQLRTPGDLVRNAPIAQSFPLDLRTETEVLLPEAWPVDAENVSISNDYFDFRHELSAEPTRLHMVDTLRTKVDHVPASAAAAFAADLEKARTSLGISLYYGTEAGGADSAHGWRMNWLLLMATGLMFAVAIWLAMKVYRWDPPTYKGSSDPRLVGLGGWLVLLGIGVVLSPLQLILQLADVRFFYDLTQWDKLTHPSGDMYHPHWAPFILLELFANSFVFVWTILNIVLFFTRRTSAPTLLAMLFIVQPLIVGIDLFVAGSLGLPGMEVEPKEKWDLAGIAVRGLLWATYLLVSVRVRSTFTRRRSGALGTTRGASSEDVAQPAAS